MFNYALSLGPGRHVNLLICNYVLKHSYKSAV